MSITQDLFDKQIEHSISMRRYSKSVELLLERASVRHRSRLRELLKGNLKANVKPEVNRYVQELYGTSKDSIADLFGAELSFQGNSLKSSVGEFYKVKKPSRSEVSANFTSKPMKLGLEDKKVRGLKDSLSSIGDAEITRINARVRKGIAQGKTENSIIKDVLKTSKLTEHQAKTLVATNITQLDSTVSEAFYRNNEELFKGVIYTSILDGRTSKVCSGLDGTFQTIDNIRYRPPLHWNCRSTLTYVLKSKQELLEIDSTRIDKTKLEKLSADRLPGNLPLKEDFSQWLRRQEFEKQKQYLGSEERVTLFQRGNLQVKDFFSLKGNPISIAALKLKDARLTYFVPNRSSSNPVVPVQVQRPFQLIRSRKATKDLRAMIIADASNSNNPLSLVDYKGTSLAGKKSVRRRSNNEFDPRVSQVDPFTGEVKNSYFYDPDFVVLQERLDYMRNSKLLDRNQKDFIENFDKSLEDQIGVNQRTAVIENLRVNFERYQRNKEPWDDFVNVVRSEMNFSVVNTSRILDRRSRSRAELFSGFTGDIDEPSVMVLGEKVTLKQLSENKLQNERFSRAWRTTYGRPLARSLYNRRKAPWRFYFYDKHEKKKPFFKRLKAMPDKLLKDVLGKPLYNFIKDLKDPKAIPIKLKQNIASKYRSIIDLEFLHSSRRKGLIDKLISVPNSKQENAIQVMAKLMEVVAEGRTTDYDSLAILIGKELQKSWPGPNPFFSATLQDYHREGSRVLNFFRDQGTIRINTRGTVRRATMDLDTLRPSGNWKDTVSREVTVVDPDMLKLQKANQQIILSNRIGVDQPRNKYYVKPGHKTYFDARGNDTGIPVVTRSAFELFDAKQIDSDFANMLNHTMSTQYEVDNEFFTFMDYLTRFKDQRGKAQYYDELNEFRKEIIRRGDLGYGMMETARYHNARQAPFTVHARIDSRGRVYYNGYLTPTGGEVIRPFLNSAKATPMTTDGLKQIQIQLASIIGPAQEVLTTSGRLAVFKRHEKDILRIGELLQAKTQRDRRIREFLDDPFMRTIEGEEVAKVARFALEYKRIYDHMDGKIDFPDKQKLATYKSKLMGEADASASGLQVISLSTGNRGAALASNVIPTRQKQRVYDTTAQDVASDPRFIAMMEELGLDLTWEDLSKAAKYQNMIALYGAGPAGQVARVAEEMAKVLRKKEGITVTTRAEFNALRRQIKARVRDAEMIGADDVVADLKSLDLEITELLQSGSTDATDLLARAAEVHPDVEDFVRKYTNNKNIKVGPEHFKQIAYMLSEKLAERAPVTQTYIDFWKRVATDYAKTTNKVEVPWVTFDNKVLMQKYRPKVQQEIRFYDPESGRYIKNIYQKTAETDKLLGKGSIGDVRLGLAVNGNHSLDASLVRMFHLKGRKNNIGTATIHDAIFTNINELDPATILFLETYQEARDFNNIKATLVELRKSGLPSHLYRKYMKEAEELGFFDNGFSSQEILAPLKPGFDRYGVGP